MSQSLDPEATMDKYTSFSVSRLSLGDVELSLDPVKDSEHSQVLSVSQVRPGEVRIQVANFTGTLVISRTQKVGLEEPPGPPSSVRTGDVEATPRRSNGSQKHIVTQNEGGGGGISPSAAFELRESVSATSSIDGSASDGLLVPRLGLMSVQADEPHIESCSSEGDDDTQDGEDIDGTSSFLQRNINENSCSGAPALTEKSISLVESKQVVISPATSDILSMQSTEATLASDSGFPTILHRACARPNVTLLELESILVLDQDAVSISDERGRLPLHILSENQLLLESRKGRLIAREFSLQLMELYSDGITTEDAEGRMPFTKGVIQWVSDTHASHDTSTDRAFLGNRNNQTSHQGGGSSSNGPLPLHLSDFTTSKHSRIEFDSGPVVEWLFVMLATGLDQVSGKNKTGKQKPSRKRIRASRMALAENVASIQNLFKTILLIEDSDSRHKLLSLSITKRVALCSKSIGTWVLWMLHSPGTPSNRVVDYFELISQVSLMDFVGEFRSPRPEDLTYFHEERAKAVDVVAGMDIVPSLTVLESHEIERAASTDLIWKILTDGISRPFVIGIVVIDFVLHIALILSFRTQALVLDPYNDKADPFGSSDFEFGTTMTLASYFMVRIVSQGVAFLFTSTRVFRSFFLNIWKLLDVVTVVLTMFAACAIHYEGGDASLSAITIGLLWLKLLLFLRNINLQLATYVLAIIEIVKDIRWFMVIVIIALLMFGEMMHIVATQTNGGSICLGDPDVAVTDFCSDEFWNSLLRMYTVLLGDFNLHTYLELTGITLLFVFFTLLGFIVLLNVLIAVVGDSYEKSRLASRRLFGRARIGFLAEHLAMERFLHPRFRKFGGRSDDPSRRCSTVRRVLSKLGRWAILASFVGAAAFSGVFMIIAVGRLLLRERDEIALAIVVIIMCLLLYLALLAVLSFLFGGWLDSASTPRMKRTVETFNSCMLRAIRLVSVGVFGAPANLSSSWGGASDEKDEWQGRLDFLLRSVTSIVAKSERGVQTAVQSAEGRLKDHERILTKHLSSRIDKMKQG